MIQQREESKDQIKYGSMNIDYYIKRSKRVKTSELIVDSDRIEVRTPLNKTLGDARDLVRDKAQWILRKQKQLKSSIPEIKKPTFEEDSTLPYFGKNYPLIIKKDQSRGTLAFIDGEFVVNITSHKIDDDTKFQIKHLYEDWIVRKAYLILKAKAKIYSQRLEVNVPKILIKNSLKSRWASLTRNDSINFNMHLIKAPEDVIDYIVLHEVCHLKIKGHSHHYWDLVYRFMPNYHDKIEWLSINGRVLVVTTL